ncbi:hypothetical protein K2Q08_01815 [Patescibacteria group bacterium]|nr:hypothetical protein [Patescibacteria group bacterium]
MPLDETPGRGGGDDTPWDLFRIETRYTFGTVVPQRCPALVPGPFVGSMVILGLSNPNIYFEWEWPGDDIAADNLRKKNVRKVAKLSQENFGLIPTSVIVSRILGQEGTVLVVTQFDAIFTIASPCGMHLLDAAFLHILLRLGAPTSHLDPLALRMDNPYWPLFREL